MKPDIILTGKGHAGTQATLDAEFATHRLFEAQDKEKFLRELAPKVRALATFGHMPVNGALMDKLPKLELIANFGVGYETIDAKEAARRGIIVTNTPDVLNEEVADTALALLLATVKELPQADRHTLEMCMAQCDVLMQSSERRRGIAALVRTKLFRDSGVFPTLSDMAAELDLHPRTLRRRLAEEGTSFRDLLNEARSTMAVDLLRNVGLTVEEVSTRLGYTEVSTFSHAFKRWYGVAPSVYSHRG